ncbi:MAG TPA: hypothetical protein VK541_11345 [Pedobacter sp.]|uniref:helix-turn-helix transcriptional regulator n=1 Tax=Pedobacter sp. TaxID=1411316 RepID=UPI002B50CC11|nr:hypothetical protein [Pedobacter sp.]HMI03070.1 hypothetical protein [Pedobacter sp.]
MEELLIKYLCEGRTQPEIAELFKESGIKPNSLSSIEKMIKRLKEKHGARTSFHLGVILSKGKVRKVS